MDSLLLSGKQWPLIFICLALFLTIKVFPAYSEESIYKQNDLVSLNVETTPIRNVLQSLAKLKGVNLLMSDKVTGNVTLNLHNVDWSTALELILELKGLSYSLHGNILLVASAKETSQRQLDKLTSQKKLQQTEPLFPLIVAINFAKAMDIASTLKASGNNIMTARGQVAVDERTNTLIIKDTKAAITTINSVIERLDIPAKQVLIEARMVTVRDNVDEQLGIRWGISAHSTDRKNVLASSTNATSQISTNQTVDISDKFNVNLPVANPAGSFALQVAKLADGTLLDLELSALERESKGEIVATPRVLATNQNLSRIEQGTEIPYLQAASHGATSVAFKKAVLSLEVTPQVTPTNEIILELSITQDARGESVITSTGPAVAIDTQQIQTKVSVKDGETIVLGGIYQQQMINAVTKVPILGDIPYLGWLFRTDTSYNEKRELLVFVTPKIIQ